jgi:hypothetical protein
MPNDATQSDSEPLSLAESRYSPLWAAHGGMPDEPPEGLLDVPVNAAVFCPVYEDARTVTLEHAVADRAPELAGALDVSDVNRIVSHIAPHLLELHRRKET